MSRTGLDAATLARSLRTAAGDGSIEWVSQPIQTSVLLDIADMLDENAKLRELVRISIEYCNSGTCDGCPIQDDDGSCPYAEMALKLGVGVIE
jgi:hypothetical protein